MNTWYLLLGTFSHQTGSTPCKNLGDFSFRFMQIASSNAVFLSWQGQPVALNVTIFCNVCNLVDLQVLCKGAVGFSSSEMDHQLRGTYMCLIYRCIVYRVQKEEEVIFSQTLIPTLVFITCFYCDPILFDKKG